MRVPRGVTFIQKVGGTNFLPLHYILLFPPSPFVLLTPSLPLTFPSLPFLLIEVGPLNPARGPGGAL